MTEAERPNPGSPRPSGAPWGGRTKPGEAYRLAHRKLRCAAGLLILIWVVGGAAAAAAQPLSRRAGGAGTQERGASAPAAQPAKASTAEKEQRFDQSQISIWLNPLAHALHVSADTLWAAVYWINFALLVYFLYFLLCRLKGWSLGGQMRGRTQFIQRKLAEASEAKSEADERLRSIERRLERLHEEVARLQAQAAEEAETEYRRLGEESAAEADKIARLAAQHIEAAGKAARQELRQFAGELAVDLAERQLRRRLTTEMDRRVVFTSLAKIEADGRRRG